MSYIYNNISSSENIPRFYNGMKFNHVPTNGDTIRPDKINVDGMTNFAYFFQENYYLPKELIGNYQLLAVDDMFNPIYVTEIPFELDLTGATYTTLTIRAFNPLKVRFKPNTIRCGIALVTELNIDSLFQLINGLSDDPVGNSIKLYQYAKPTVETQNVKIVDGLAVACEATDPDKYGTIEDYITNIKHRGAIVYAL